MPPPVCDTPECSQALARLQAARNAILSLCSQISQLRASAAILDSQARTWGTLAGVFLALAAAAIGIPIPILNWVIAALLLAAALTFAIIAINFAARLGEVNRQITALLEELVAAREAFDKAVTDVMAQRNRATCTVVRPAPATS